MGLANSEVIAMKTLYVTDLDGTLLNTNREVSDDTVALLNQCIEQGVDFTVATARTPATVVPLLERIHLKLPVIVMNGSFIYDIQKARYVHTSQIPHASVEHIIKTVESKNKQIFIYTLQEEMLTVYHKGYNSEEERKFCNDRSDLTLKKFVEVEAYTLTEADKVGHMVMIDHYQVIKEIVEALEGVEGIHAVMYRDVNTEDSYLLEIAVANGNKAKGIEALRHLVAFDQVVAFGDNLNDLEMLQAADLGCAVGNAQEEVKQCADCMIGTNDEEGVANFIKAHAQV